MNNVKIEEEITKLLSNNHLYDFINNGFTFDEWFHSLSYDDFKKLIIELNNTFRPNDENYDDFYYNTMTIGGKGTPTLPLISWNNNLKEDDFKKMFGALKKIDSNKERALLSYYYLLDLHLFSDGNGRISRFIYDFFNGEGDINLQERIGWYVHNNSNEREIKEKFEEANGFPDIKTVNNLISIESYHELLKQLNDLGIEIPNYVKKSKYIYTMYEFNKIEDNIGFIPEHIADELGVEKTTEFGNLFMDSAEGTQYGIGGLSILYVALQNGTYKYLEERAKRVRQANIESGYITDDAPYRIVFGTGRVNIFENWSLNDFEKALEFGRYLKNKQFEKLLELFTNPELSLITGDDFIEPGQEKWR